MKLLGKLGNWKLDQISEQIVTGEIDGNLC